MNKNYFLTVVLSLTTLLLLSCGQNPSTEQDAGDIPMAVENNLPNDSITLKQAFEALKKDKKFLKDLALDDEEQFSWNDDFYRSFRGDLNGDDKPDAMLAFVIEGRGGGNNSDVHYAVLLNEENKWKYSGQLNASIFVEDRFFEIQKIENAVIKGNWVGNKDQSLTPYSAEYVFKNNQLVNTFTALHKGENVAREYLFASEIITNENTSIPLEASLEEYQNWLGKGKIVPFEEHPDCGTHFDNGLYSELQYPNLIIELSDNEKGTFSTLTLKESGFKLNTDKGTLTESTTIAELENCLNANDSWWINDEENGDKTLIIPDGEGSDNQLHILFDKTGSLVKVDFFVPC